MAHSLVSLDKASAGGDWDSAGMGCMNRKQLANEVAEYFRALQYAILFETDLSPEQFAACRFLDPEDMEQFLAELARQNVSV